VGLSERQAAMLSRWGYPYVLDEFRLHVTLTSRLHDGDATTLRAALDDWLGPALPAPFVLDALSLCGDPGDGRPFATLRRHALGGA
jgi:hypothetical protein